jgi:hypothetical protein
MDAMKIAFYKGTHAGLTGVFNRLVRWWTRGPYSHCEVVFSERDASGAALCASSSKMDGGVRLKFIALKPENWDIWEVPSADEAAVKAWFDEHVGCKYDVLGLVGFVWRRTEDDRSKFFCSEACAAALGIEEAWRFDPNTFAAAIRRAATIGGAA